MRTVGEMLADYVLTEADWRRSEAEDHPEDARHGRSAEALTQLAEWVEGLPEDHIDLGVLDSVETVKGWDTENMDYFEPCEATARLTSRYGFHFTQDRGAWLREVVDAEVMVAAHRILAWVRWRTGELSQAVGVSISDFIKRLIHDPDSLGSHRDEAAQLMKAAIQFAKITDPDEN